MGFILNTNNGYAVKNFGYFSILMIIIYLFVDTHVITSTVLRVAYIHTKKLYRVKLNNYIN